MQKIRRSWASWETASADMDRRMKFLFAAQQLNPHNRLQHKQLLGQQWRVQDQLLVAHSCPRHRTVASKHRTGSLEAKQRKSTSFLGWFNCNTRSVSSNLSTLMLDVSILIKFLLSRWKERIPLWRQSCQRILRPDGWVKANCDHST